MGDRQDDFEDNSNDEFEEFESDNDLFVGDEVASAVGIKKSYVRIDDLLEAKRLRDDFYDLTDDVWDEDF